MFYIILRGGVGLFKASEYVSRDEWHNYVSKLEIQRYYPGIQGLGFSVFVRPENLEAHTRSIRAQGFPDYAIKPAGERSLYSSIIYLEPFDLRNQRAFSYDMYSEPLRRKAMENARDNGTATISGIVTLLQETETDVQKGFLMYMPFYKSSDKLDTVESRRKAIVGFVYSPFRINDLMNGVLGHTVMDVDFTIFDDDGNHQYEMLYSTKHVNFSTSDKFSSISDGVAHFHERTAKGRIHN